MSMVANEKSVEEVVKAFVEASTNDLATLRNLLSILEIEGPKTGLGYIVTNATESVAFKVRSLEY